MSRQYVAVRHCRECGGDTGYADQPCCRFCRGTDADGPSWSRDTNRYPDRDPWWKPTYRPIGGGR